MIDTSVRIIYSDIPDPSVIRVGENYYMTSTTMYFTPGCPIMKSRDLVNWEIIGYVYDVLNDNDHMNLQNNKHDYGRGSWASCLRYHNGIFYCSFVAYNTGETYIFQTEDIEKGEWRKYVIDGIYHDMSILFDDGRVFMVYGAGAIKVVELTADATAIKPDGLNKTIIENADPTGGTGLAEGSHIYKLNGFYYIFIIAWPKTGNRRRIQVCYRANQIDGVYENKIILDDTLGFQNAGVAQGGIFDTHCRKNHAKNRHDGDSKRTLTNEWFAMLFQDHGAVGRVPVIVPVRWEDDWPVVSVGQMQTTPAKNFLPVCGIVKSDEFEKPTLALQWQWNHNPVNTLWSLTEREGWLRLKASRAGSLSDARNTLTQRTFGETCSGCVKIDVSQMQNGDFAGLAALQDQYAFVGVKMADNKKHIVMCAAPETKDDGVEGMQTYKAGIPEVEMEAVLLVQDDEIETRSLAKNIDQQGGVVEFADRTVEGAQQAHPHNLYLRVDFNFADATDEADFYFSLCGDEWTKIGARLKMSYRLSHFTGYRFALFNFATKEAGGYVDFDWFRVSSN